MTVLEKWGVYHINRYLAADRFLLSRFPLPQVTRIATIISFIIGFFITLFVALADIAFFADLNALFSSVYLISFFILLNVGLVAIEFWLLFHIGFQVIARYIQFILKCTEEMASNELASDELHQVLDLELKQSLVRAVIELNEPSVERFGLNPYRNKHKHYWARVVLYKLKVILSNVIAKIIARKLLSRIGLRAYAPLISTIITGWWDAWVQSAVLKEVRFRMAGRLYVIRLLSDLKRFMHQGLTNPDQQSLWLEALIRLVAVRIEYFGVYNINLDYLIIELDNLTSGAAQNGAAQNSTAQNGTAQSMESLFDIHRLTQVYQQLSQSQQSRLARIAMYLLAFKVGKLSQQEMEILAIFNLERQCIDEIKLQYDELFSDKIDELLMEV